MRFQKTTHQVSTARSRFDLAKRRNHDREECILKAVRTAPRSPWQNAYVERVIGSIRRECLDQVIVTNAAGLHRVLRDYVAYYVQSQTHLALDKDTPCRDRSHRRQPIAGSSCGLQKSNCALSLNMRGSRISCGVRHAAPYVMFSLITELELSTL